MLKLGMSDVFRLISLVLVLSICDEGTKMFLWSLCGHLEPANIHRKVQNMKYETVLAHTVHILILQIDFF